MGPSTALGYLKDIPAGGEGRETCMKSNIKPVGKKTGSPAMATSKGQRVGKQCLLSNAGDGRHEERDSQRTKTHGTLALCPPGPLLSLEELLTFLIQCLTSYRDPGVSGLVLSERKNLEGPVCAFLTPIQTCNNIAVVTEAFFANFSFAVTPYPSRRIVSVIRRV